MNVAGDPNHHQSSHFVLKKGSMGHHRTIAKGLSQKTIDDEHEHSDDDQDARKKKLIEMNRFKLKPP